MWGKGELLHTNLYHIKSYIFKRMSLFSVWKPLVERHQMCLPTHDILVFSCSSGLQIRWRQNCVAEGRCTAGSSGFSSKFRCTEGSPLPASGAQPLCNTVKPLVSHHFMDGNIFKVCARFHQWLRSRQGHVKCCRSRRQTHFVAVSSFMNWFRVLCEVIQLGLMWPGIHFP